MATQQLFLVLEKATINQSCDRLKVVKILTKATTTRGGSRTAATSKMERFEIKVNDWKLLTIIRNRSILDVAPVLDPPLTTTVTTK